MSLVKTLAKVAAGVVVAKGIKGMVGGGAGRGGSSMGTRQASAGGSLQDMLGQVLGGGGRPAGGASGGSLQDMLGQVLGGSAGGGSLGGGAARGGAAGGSLQDMLGQILSGKAGPAGQGGGGLGGALNELSQMSRPNDTGAAGGGFGDKLNQSFERFGEPDVPPTPDEEALAGVMLRAMIQAAKSDGRIDDNEKKKLMDKLGDVSREEADFVNAELKRDVDAAGLARSVPRGAEQQVYMMSALAIDLDENSEARYLGELAQNLNLDGAKVNAIHDRLGLPHIFR